MGFAGRLTAEDVWGYSVRKLTEPPEFLFSTSRTGYAYTSSSTPVDLISITGKGILLGINMSNGADNANAGAALSKYVVDGVTYDCYAHVRNPAAIPASGATFMVGVPFKSSIVVKGEAPGGLGTANYNFAYCLFSDDIAREEHIVERYSSHRLFVTKLYNSEGKLIHEIKEFREMLTQR